MDALISEWGTVALVLDGTTLGWISARDEPRVRPCSRADFNCILRDSGPLEALDGTSLPDVVQRLHLARDCDDALHLALIVLDPELSVSVRTEAAQELDELLRDQRVAAKLKATLYAKPLPPSADTTGALAACALDSAGRMQAMLQELLRLQGAIGDARRAWDAIPTSVFGSEQDRSEFQSAAVRQGLFREFVEITVNRGDAALFLVESLLNPAIQTLPNSRAALQVWVGPLKQEARHPEVAKEIAAREEEVGRGKKKQRKAHGGHTAFERMKRQKPGIISAMRRGDRRMVSRFVEELVAFHLETGGAEFASKSLCNLAMEAKALDQLDLQLHLVEKAVALKPDDTWARVQYADALRSNGRLDEALAAYDATIAEHPGDVVARNGRAETLRALNRLDEALAAYDATIAEHPGDVVARNGRAETLRALNRLDEALAAYDATIAEHPRDVVAKAGRAETLRALNRLDEALAAYDATIAEHPRDVVARNGRAETLRALNRLDEALAAYDAIIAEHPENVVARNGSAETLRALNRLDEALAAYEETRARFPYDEFSRCGGACVLAALGRYREALDALPQGSPVSAPNWIAYHIRGMIHLRMGHVEEALRIFEDGLRRAPQPASRDYFRAGAALVRLRQRRYESVRDILEQVTEPRVRTPASVLRLHALGALHLQQQASETYRSLPLRSPPLVIELVEELRRRYLNGAEPQHDDEWVAASEEQMLLLAA